MMTRLPFYSRRAALTLLEMMVAVTLLALIMIGLLAMFQQVQRALHVAHAQTDVFENARGAIQIVARDLSEMTSFGQPAVRNAIGTDGALIGDAFLLPGPPPFNLKIRFQDVFWLTHANDDWRGVGYFVADDQTTGKTNSGVGTLYRFTKNVSRDRVSTLFGTFIGPSYNDYTHRISDGIVHFAVVPTYPTRINQFVQAVSSFNFPSAVYPEIELPAYVDVEIGVLEPATLKQFRALKDFDSDAAKNFLRDHVGRIHFFRERVPIRNFVNPYRSNEVP